MLTGFVLILAEPSRIAALSEELAGLDGVSEVYSVTGEWDLVAVVRVRDHERLADVVTIDIAKLEGIRRTETMVAFRAYSRHDLEAGPLEHAQQLQTLIESATKEQVLFDAGHKLPADYVPHAVEWIKKHL